MSTSHAALGAASDDRKARLAKLKTLKRKQPADEIVAPESERSATPPAPSDPDPDTSTATATTALAAATAQEEAVSSEVARLHLSGRNYDAAARGAKLGFEAPPTLALEGPTLEEQAGAVAAEARRRAAEDAAAADRGVDLFGLQPRKPNWDLRRDLDRKLEVLNVRTDNAIARLVRERVAAAQALALERKRNNRKNKAAETGGGGGGGGGEGEDEGEGEGEGVDGDKEGEAAGMDGVALVEGLRVREREEEEEERREREEEREGLVE